MTAKEIKALESYFITDNDHWNDHLFEMFCDAIEQGQFEDLGQPLKLFSSAIKIFTTNSENPIKAIELFSKELDKNKFDDNQKVFIYEWTQKYLRHSEFDEDLGRIEDLLDSQLAALKGKIEPNKPKVQNIRESLKEMIREEIKKLPGTLKKLEPQQRLNILCKLIPFVLPRVESIHHTQDE